MSATPQINNNPDKMPRWYYLRRELRQSPSVLKGLDPTIEARYRREGARFIIELGTSMNLSLSSTMATAVVFFHRFYMCHSFQDFPRYPTACACLFLAGKVEETPKKCRDMIESARRLLEEPKFSEQFGAEEKNRLEELMTLERILLQTIKFDLQLEHPYKYLLKYATLIKGEKNRLEKMVQMAWNFVNDSLCTTLCLQWEPEIIAIALMHLACKLSKFDVLDWTGRQSDHLRWWDMFVEDMTIDVLEDICHQVLDFYSTAQGVTPPALTEQTPGTNTPVNINTSPKLTASQPGIPHNPNVVPRQASVPTIPTPPTSYYPPPTPVMFPAPPPTPPSYSSPIPSKMNNAFIVTAPAPFFTHQPPPPMAVNSPQPPPPPLPQPPPPPPPNTSSPSVPLPPPPPQK